MIGNNLVCDVCNLEPATEACTCDRRVMLIGPACLADHLKDTFVAHDVVSIELGLIMREDPNLIETYFTRALEVNRLTYCIRMYSNQIDKHLQSLNESKRAVNKEVDSTVNHAGSILEGIKAEIRQVYRVVTDYKRTMCEEGSLLIKQFEENGERSLMKNYIDTIEIRLDPVLEAVRRMISLGHHQVVGSDSYNERARYEETISELNLKIQSKDLL